MKEVRLVQKSIRRLPRGKPFTAKSIGGIASNANVRQVLSRLTKTGEIVRATRGIYVRPKEVPYLGRVLPGSEEIIKIISERTGEIIIAHGAEAAYKLNLSTQVPVQHIYYTTGTSRRLKIGSLYITLKHISPSKLIKPGTLTCLIILALWYLGRNQVDTKTISKLQERLNPKQFNEVLKYTQHMPAWMSDAFKQHEKELENGY